MWNMYLVMIYFSPPQVIFTNYYKWLFIMSMKKVQIYTHKLHYLHTFTYEQQFTSTY